MRLGSTQDLVVNTQEGSFLEVSTTSPQLSYSLPDEMHVPELYSLHIQPCLTFNSVLTKSGQISAAIAPQYLKFRFSNCSCSGIR